MRKWPVTLFALIAAVGAPAWGYAQGYPNKPIRLIVPYSAGGGTDTTGRIIAEALGARLGQPIVVENKAGAGALIGTDFVAKAPADGYVLLYGAGDSTTVMSAVKHDMPYKVPDDFSFIARTASAPYAVAINANLPFNTLADLISYAKGNPGKLRYGSSGVGVAAHLATVLLEKHAGMKMTLVSYKGNAQVVTDLIAGVIDVALIPPPTIHPHSSTGKAKLLAQTGVKRHSLIPEVPTTADLGLPGVNVLTWYGIMAPAALPPAILTQLREQIAAVITDPSVSERLSKFGLHADLLVGDDFRKFAVDELKSWNELAKSENIVLQE